MTASLSEVIRRKLLLSAGDSDISDNDDVDERMRRRRHKLEENASRNFPKPPPGPPRPGPTGSNAIDPSASTTKDDSANDDIVKHYGMCIQLARDNKITVRNAFSLHLIQDMKELLKDPQLNNFSSASFVLDASAKIYSFRVDRIHTETVRIASSLGGLKNRKSTEDQAGAEAEENKRERPRRVTKGKNIVTNLDRINLTNLNQQAEFDPIMKKISAKFNLDGPTTGAFQSTLHHYKPDYGLLLSSNAPYLFKPVPHSPSKGLDNVDITDFHDLLKNIKPGAFCPTFVNFHFRAEAAGEWSSSIFNETLDENFNIIPGASVEGAFVIGDQLHENSDCDAPELAASFVDLTSTPTCSTSVSGSCTKSESISPKEKKKKPPKPKKVPFVLKFDLETDVDRFFTKKENRIPSITRQNWMGKSTTLDEDLPVVDKKSFKKLFLNSKISLHLGERRVNQDHDLDDYDYENAHDGNISGNSVGQYDANSELDDSIGGQGDGEQSASGFSLIEKPFTVFSSELKIPYPRFAKSVNVKHLKSIMWNWISENAINGKRVSFSALYVKLKNSVSENTAKDLSEAIVLNCLLSLVNEKALKIESNENLEDFVIYI